MSESLRQVDHTGNKVTEEEAENTGKQVGMAVTAAIIESGLLRFVGMAFTTMQASSHFDVFMKNVLDQVGRGVRGANEGFEARQKMAKFLRSMAGELRDQAASITVQPAVQMSMVEELDSLVETAKTVDKCARVLDEHLQHQMELLINRGAAVRSQKALVDQITRAAQCDDPNCECHKSKPDADPEDTLN